MASEQGSGPCLSCWNHFGSLASLFCPWSYSGHSTFEPFHLLFECLEIVAHTSFRGSLLSFGTLTLSQFPAWLSTAGSNIWNSLSTDYWLLPFRIESPWSILSLEPKAALGTERALRVNWQNEQGQGAEQPGSRFSFLSSPKSQRKEQWLHLQEQREKRSFLLGRRMGCWHSSKTQSLL